MYLLGLLGAAMVGFVLGACYTAWCVDGHNWGKK